MWAVAIQLATSPEEINDTTYGLVLNVRKE